MGRRRGARQRGRTLTIHGLTGRKEGACVGDAAAGAEVQRLILVAGVCRLAENLGAVAAFRTEIEHGAHDGREARVRAHFRAAIEEMRLERFEDLF